MSQLQSDWADRAIAYAEQATNRRSAREILTNLARVFWCPENMDDFQPLATDGFADATVRFACLINLQPGGNFTPPRSACSILVRLKYFIRAGLNAWSRDNAKALNLPSDRWVPLFFFLGIFLMTYLLHQYC
jgi:hypothetical protein